MSRNAPVVLSLALLLPFALGGCAGKRDEPRIELTDVGFTLHLPAPMQQALESAAPGFRPIRSTSYRSDVAQAAATSGGASSLSATVGDFNHDGAEDAAVEGTVPGDSALQVFAIMNGPTPTAVEVARFPVYDADAVGIYLAPPPAPASGAAGAGGFEVVDYPDSSIVYRYENGALTGTKAGN